MSTRTKTRTAAKDTEGPMGDSVLRSGYLIKGVCINRNITVFLQLRRLFNEAIRIKVPSGRSPNCRIGVQRCRRDHDHPVFFQEMALLQERVLDHQTYGGAVGVDTEDFLESGNK